MRALFLSLTLMATAYLQAQICRNDTTYQYQFYNGNNTKVLVSRIVYQYNSNGVLEADRIQNWDANKKAFQPYYERTHTYNGAGLETETLVRLWNAGKGLLINNARMLYQYDANGHLIDYLYYTFNSNSVWEGVNHMVYTCDANKNDTLILTQRFNTSSKTWYNYARQRQSYDANSMRTSYEVAYAPNGYWANDKRNTVTYNADKQITAEAAYRWDPSIGNWDMTGRSESFYDGSKRLIKMHSYMLFSGGVEKNFNLSLYQYNNQNLVTILTQKAADPLGVDTFSNLRETYYTYKNNLTTEELVKWWHPRYQTYVNNNRYLYAYNGYQQPTTTNYQSWDTVSNQWQHVYRYLRTYNQDSQMLSNDQDDYVNQRWVPNYHNTYEYNLAGRQTAHDNYNDYDTAGQFFYSHRRDEFFCAYDASSIHSNTHSKILEVYPNPSSTNFNVLIPEACTYQLFDRNGKLIQSGQFQPGQNLLNTEHLNSGLYYLQTPSAGCFVNILRM